MLARFLVISREEILNFVKKAISKNAVKAINFFFLFIDVKKLLRMQTPVFV